MATSSILKNFIISDNEQAEIFANAIEVQNNCERFIFYG